MAILATSALLSSDVAPYGKFADGLLSKTTPTGWLREFCERQKTGLTGHPEALSYPYNTCLWAGEISRMGTHGDGWWRYEQTAYYTDGLLKLGYALKDADFIAKGEAGVEYTLAHQTSEGQLGHPALWDTKNYKVDPNCLTWPMSVFFRVMKAKYDASPDPRIPAALEKYYLNYTPKQLAVYRNIVSVEGMLWTYAKTGNKRLLELAEEAWNMTTPHGKWADDALCPRTCLSNDPLYVHGVTYCEVMKVPMLLAAYTGKKEYLDQAVLVERKLVGDHMLPDGCPSSVEQTRGNSIHWGHETCDISDFTWSVGYALETTGEAWYADEIEKCVFNAGLGVITKDFKALQYFSCVNQFLATGTSNQNPYYYGSTWQQYRPTHETECCAGSVHRFMPNYISRMWLKDAKGEPVAALYGPCEVDYGFVKIREETEYPFEGKIRFVFSLDEPKEFGFTYRVPRWCYRGANVRVNGETLVESGKVLANGEAVDPHGVGAFHTIRRTFKDGDVVELDFWMGVAYCIQSPRKYVIKDAVTGDTLELEGAEKSQGVALMRGPLVYSFPIETEETEDKDFYANMNGKKSANSDFKCLKMTPKGPFNYALEAKEAKVIKTGAKGYPFDLKSVPVMLEVPVHKILWKLRADGTTPDIPRTIVPDNGLSEKIRLVPYGATCLRLTVFPILGE